MSGLAEVELTVPPPSQQRRPSVFIADSSMAGDVASRNLFYCVGNDRISPGEKPACYCGCCNPTFGLQHGEASSQEDELLRMFAREAMARFRQRAEGSVLVGKSHGLSFEQRTENEFALTSSGVLPCTARELTQALSPDNTDRWNASMIEIFGSDFAYGVKVRTVAVYNANCRNSQASDDLDANEAHLSVKMAHFCGTIPLLSSKSTTFFLDYVESESNASGSGITTRRVIQTIKEDDAGVMYAGDVLAGYQLQEDRVAQHTLLLYHASHTANRLREPTIQRLQKLGSLVSKAEALVLRRRLGAQKLIDESSSSNDYSRETDSFASASTATVSVSRSDPAYCPLQPIVLEENPDACTGCASSLTGLLKKKRSCRLCGQQACGSCVAKCEAEQRIGIVMRVLVCTPCLDRLQSEAFLASEDV